VTVLVEVAAIGLGSNLGSGPDSGWGGGREGNLREAIRRVGLLGRVKAISSFYDTAPVGVVEQPRFLNGAMLLETSRGPLELMRELLKIERAMGRERTVAKGPRVIDLDLLLYGMAEIDMDELTVPHTAMQERRFVLEPLSEIAPAMVHPGLGLTVGEMLGRLKRWELRNGVLG
jgi:2-amino-4-hydroxy-6-hydroxymethyldihydropteridine diphosphokinase